MTFKIGDVVQLSGEELTDATGEIIAVESDDVSIHIALDHAPTLIGVSPESRYTACVVGNRLPPVPKRGEHYRHYKGRLYVVVGLANTEADDVPRVVYRSVADDKFWWVRSLRDWQFPVWDGKQRVRRFTRVP